MASFVSIYLVVTPLNVNFDVGSFLQVHTSIYQERLGEEPLIHREFRIFFLCLKSFNF